MKEATTRIRWILVFALLLSGRSAVAQAVEPDIFTLELSETIVLGEEIPIGGISSIDRRDGTILFVDMFTRAVYLMSETDRAYTRLDPEPCHPGLAWSPTKAVFLPDGRIFVHNGRAPTGFIFQPGGECGGAVPIVTDYDAFCPTSETDIATFSKPRGDGAMLQVYDLEGRVLSEATRENTAAERFENLINRLNGSNLIACDGETIWLSLVVGSEIYQYDRRLEQIGVIAAASARHSSPSQDIVDARGDYQRVRASINETLAGNARNVSLAVFGSGQLMRFYRIGRGAPALFGLQIVSKDGRVHYELTRDWPILLGPGGEIYVVDQPQPNDAGDIPNPTVQVLRAKLAP